MTLSVCSTLPQPLLSSDDLDRIQLQKEELLYTTKKAVQAKLATQLHFALKDPLGNIKQGKQAFLVDLKLPPRLLSSSRAFAAGAASFQGNEAFLEDGVLNRVPVSFQWQGQKQEALLFGLFDGMKDQGKTALYARSFFGPCLGELLSKTCQETAYVNEEAVTHCFTQACNLFCSSYREKGLPGGASATFVFIHKSQIYCANIGMCRITLVKSQGAYQLTEDADPSKPRFQKWHHKHGNKIEKGGIRAQTSSQVLPTARALGSYDWMCFRPKITSVSLGNEADSVGNLFCRSGDFMVLSTPSFNQCATKQEVATAIDYLARQGAKVDQIATRLIGAAMKRENGGNVSVLVIAI